MKKILSVILVLACMLALFSCDFNLPFGNGGNNGDNANDHGDSLSAYRQMYASSVPTKSVTTITEAYDKNTLTSVHTLTTGQIDGKVVTVLDSTVQTLNNISLEDATSLNLKPINEKKTSQWYYEGKGITYNKGKTWDASGVDFAPNAGSITINLDESNFKQVTYTKDTEAGVETLVLEVEAEKMDSVLANFMYEGQTFGYDSVITIIAAGGRISSIIIEYTIEEYTIGEMETEIEIREIDMSIRVDYAYDLQEITLG